MPSQLLTLTKGLGSHLRHLVDLTLRSHLLHMPQHSKLLSVALTH